MPGKKHQESVIALSRADRPETAGNRQIWGFRRFYPLETSLTMPENYNELVK